MQVAVAGGTGTVGREVVAELARRGHDVRALSRSTPARLPEGVRHHRVDVVAGTGLAEALDGADAVVDAADGHAALLQGTRRLLAAEAAAGVAHHVAVSVVGTDRVPYRYYRDKLAQEQAVRGSAVPWTIVRATQFHATLHATLARAARWGVLPAFAFPLQPVDELEVATAIVDTVEADPSGAVTQFAGPELRSVRELAATWRVLTGSRALVVPMPLPGAGGRALRAGGLTNPGAWTGRVPFAAWLRERSSMAPMPAGVPVGGAA